MGGHLATLLGIDEHLQPVPRTNPIQLIGDLKATRIGPGQCGVRVVDHFFTYFFTPFGPTSAP